MKADDIAKYFKSLREFSEFMEDLVEAANGEEIARGMNPNDKSKEQKSPQSSSGEDPSAEDPGAEPPGGEGPQEGAMPPGGEAPPEGPTLDPVAAPGSQVSIGKKVKNTIHTMPKTKKLDVKAEEKNEVVLKPFIKVDPRYL